MGRMRGEPNGAALTTPNDWEDCPLRGSITGCVGKKGAKCFFLHDEIKFEMTWNIKKNVKI
jgi:hypothetical protein